ncbi:MAG TPA: glycohydrolase toxin TNT-related protein [Pseudonocardiaceae bacterium]|nr:glycohydrolase toxin TNT-related protein [Pseudonocardiaceae bacterium]
MTALPDPDLSRAVLIGTSTFDRLPNLPAVRNNLTDLSTALTDPDSGILTATNCSIMDSPETATGFLRRLRTITRQANDFLLVYYAGHGIRHDTRDLLYLAVQDTDADGPEGTAVRFDSVREIIEDSPARTRLLILDCCYSGMALGAMAGGTTDPRELTVSGTAVITSSSKNKISHSPQGDRLTAFSGELISLLTNGSPIPNEPLTVLTAFRSLTAALATRGLPEPKLKLTDTSGDILLRRPTKLAPEPERAAPPLLPRRRPLLAHSPTGSSRQSRGWPIRLLPGEPPQEMFRDTHMEELEPGFEVDRFGTPEGNLTFGVGTPFEQRSLVPEWRFRPYHVYRVVRRVWVLTGTATSAYDQPGGGTAYVLPSAVAKMLDDGELIEVPVPAAPTDKLLRFLNWRSTPGATASLMDWLSERSKRRGHAAD